MKVVRLLAENPAFQETEATRSVLADKLLESRVRDALSDGLGIEMVISPIEVIAANGKVTLMATTMRNQLRADVEQLVRGTAGVNENPRTASWSYVLTP